MISRDHMFCNRQKITARLVIFSLKSSGLTLLFILLHHNLSLIFYDVIFNERLSFFIAETHAVRQ